MSCRINQFLRVVAGAIIAILHMLCVAGYRSGCSCDVQSPVMVHPCVIRRLSAGVARADPFVLTSVILFGSLIHPFLDMSIHRFIAL